MYLSNSLEVSKKYDSNELSRFYKTLKLTTKAFPIIFASRNFTKYQLTENYMQDKMACKT